MTSVRALLLIAAQLAALLFSSPLAAQRPDSTRRDTTARRPPTTRADSLSADSARIADSLSLVREIERMRADPRTATTPQQGAQAGTQGPINPRLLPDISAVGDLIADLSPDESTQEDRTRFGIREIEVALQAAVDPYFRGDIFVGLSDEEGIAIEQAYLTATALAFGLEVRLGRFLSPVGKQNTIHRHDLHTIEYPWVSQRFFGPEGLRGTGIWVSKIFAPLGFYQELILTAVDRFGEPEEGLETLEPVNRKLSGLGYGARFRNYWDLSQSANLELSASAVTGRREQPIADFADASAVAARQSVVGVDVTYRWRPLQQGLYKSFILQGELMRQANEDDPALPVPSAGGLPPTYLGPNRDLTGGYVFGRYQLTRRTYLGARFDAVQEADADGETLYAGSGYFEVFPSEFSKLLVGYERLEPPGGAEAQNRFILQASFALGPHKPHPF